MQTAGNEGGARRSASWWLALAGLLASMGTACSGGVAGPEGSGPRAAVTPAMATRAEDAAVLGMELPGGWSIATPGATIAQATTHAQGSYALAVRPSSDNGYTPIKSAPLSTLDGVSPTLAVELRLPNEQANPGWLGAAQAYLECPSLGIYNQYLGQVELTGMPLDAWFTARFDVPGDTVGRLQQAAYSDLTITIVLNVPAPAAGSYLIDDVRFLPPPSILAITRQPVSLAMPAQAGGAVEFTLAAAGTGPLAYAWYTVEASGPRPLGAGPDPVLSVGTYPGGGAYPQIYTFFCVVSDEAGHSVKSDTVTLTLTEPALQITRQPVSQTVSVQDTQSVEFTLSAAGTGPLTYTWYAIEPTGPMQLVAGPAPRLVLSTYPNSDPYPQRSTFFCVVSDEAGHSVKSDLFTLTLTAPAIQITRQPVNQTVDDQGSHQVELTLTATGDGPLTYTWYWVKPSGPVQLAAGPDPKLVLTTYPSGDPGPQNERYFCVVSDGAGHSAQSDTVVVTVRSPGP